MKLIQSAGILGVLSVWVSIINCFSVRKESSIMAVFEGTTPCSNIIRPLHNIKPEADCPLEECHCIMVQWKLTLFQDPVTSEPTTYKLTSINRFTVKETNMYSEPGTKNEREGKWKIKRGTKTNSQAFVYQLDPENPSLSTIFLRLSDNLIHLLDHEEKLMIGNEFWSYTLSRVAN